MNIFAHYGIMMDDWGYDNGGYGVVGLIMTIVTISIIVFGILLVARSVSKDRQAQGDSALDILKKRYASGEVDKKEFEEKKKDLG